MGEVVPARVLAQVCPIGGELEHSIAHVGPVGHVNDVLVNGKADRGVINYLECELEDTLITKNLAEE